MLIASFSVTINLRGRWCEVVECTIRTKGEKRRWHIMHFQSFLSFASVSFQDDGQS